MRKRWLFADFLQVVIINNTFLSKAEAINVLICEDKRYCTIAKLSEKDANAYVNGQKCLSKSVLEKIKKREHGDFMERIRLFLFDYPQKCVAPLTKPHDHVQKRVEQAKIASWQKMYEENRYEDIIIDAFLLCVDCELEEIETRKQHITPHTSRRIKPMKFVHLSDLHFYPKGDGRTSRNIREELITYLKELNISADELLITGDFRYAKEQKDPTDADISEVVNYINRIAEAIKIKDVKHIHLVPGNHDRSRNSGEGRRMATIRKKYEPDKGCFNEDDLEYLLEKFNYFRRVCNALYAADNYWGPSVLHTYRVIGETVFLYLNTAIMHNSDADRKQHRLIIGNDCFDQLLKEINEKHPDYPIIVLAHHSPDYFDKKEKEAVEDILTHYPQVFLYLCGDAHEAWPRKVDKHLEITMGCIKHEKNVESTFLFADTSTQEYSVHHWVKAWEPYKAANIRLQEIQ